MPTKTSPAKFSMQRRFKGFDAKSLRQDIPDELVRLADNVQVQGLPGVGGEFVTRAGYQKILASAESNPVYALSQYVTADTATPPNYATQLVYSSGGAVKIAPKTLGAASTSLNLTSGFLYSDLVVGGTNTNVSSVMRPFVASDVSKTLVIASGVVFAYSDLAIGSPNTKLSSVTRPFVASDVGLRILVSSATIFAYTDLAIDPVTNTNVSSTTRQFLPSDVGLQLVITAGTGFTPGTYTINSVTNGVATLSGAAGTIGSSNGSGSLNNYFTPGTYTINSVLSGVATLNSGIGTINTGSGIANLINGFNTGSFTINSVTNGVAGLSGAAGVAASTGGSASLASAAFNLNSANVFMNRSGKYEYIVDGQSGLFRVYIPGVNPTTAYTATQLTTEQTPGTPTSATLSGVLADQMNSANWSAAPALATPGTSTWGFLVNGLYSMISNETFSGMSTSSSAVPPKGWQTWGDSMDAGPGGSTPLWDQGNGPSFMDWETPNAGFASTHAQFTHARVFYSTCTVSGNGTLHQAIVPESSTSAGFTIQKGTDLAIQGTTAGRISSASYTFLAADAGKTITISNGTNWNVGIYTIASVNVSPNYAVVDTSVASSTSATGGTWQLGLYADNSGSAASFATPWGNNSFPNGSPTAASNMQSRGLTSGAIDYTSQCASGAQLTQVYSLTTLNTDPDYVCFRLWNPAQSNSSRCSNAVMFPIDARLKIDTTVASTSLHIQANVDKNTSQGFNCVGGSYVTRTFTGTYLNLSQTNSVSMSYAAPSTSPSTGIPFRIGLQAYGSSTIFWTLPVVYNSVVNELSADISFIPTASRKQIQNFYVQAVGDLPSTVNPQDLCTLGSITSAGNMTVNGANYNYVVTEIQNTAYNPGTSGNGTATGDTVDGIIETDPSNPTSPDLTPNTIEAQTTLTLAPIVNTAASNMAGLYRYGGVFPGLDPVGIPYYRLVKQLPLWSGNLNPATGWNWNGTVWTSTDNYVSFNPSTLVVTDNTPDSALFFATVLGTGRNALAGLAPNGVCEWQNRIVCWTGNQLNLSWLVTVNQAAGLYFNAVNYPNDPYGTIKGIQITVGGLDNDPIMACVPMGTSLIIFKQRSIWQLTGTDSTNFSLSGHLMRSGVGLIAPRAWCIQQNPNVPIMNVIWFLAADGVWEYDGGDLARPISHEIEPLISPALGTGGANLTSTLYATAAMALHDRCAYLMIGNPQYSCFDLVIQGTTTQVASLSRPFLPGDVGKIITVTGGTGFTPGAYTIGSVSSAGIATLNTSAGTAWSIQGLATLAADTANTVAYRYDMRYPGWTRYLQSSFTGAAALTTVTDTDDFFFGGLDGQIYQMTGSGDAGTPGAVSAATNATPIQITQTAHGYITGNVVRVSSVGGNTAANGQWTITKVDNSNYTLNNSVGNGTYTSSTGFGALVSAVNITIQSRALGRESLGYDFMEILRPMWMYYDIVTYESVSATLQVWADLTPSYSLAYTLSSAWGVVRERVANDTRGNVITVGYSGSSYLPTRIRAVGVESALGRLRRG